MTKTLPIIATGTRVAIANFSTLGTIGGRVAQNVYSVTLDDGRTLEKVGRSNLLRWDAKAGRGFRF